MDLSIFKDQGDKQCDKDNVDPIEGCHSVKRLMVTLKYFTLLDIIKSQGNCDIFRKFMSIIYMHCLDDLAHLVNVHDDNLAAINKALFAKKLFDECDVVECQHTSRHYSQCANTSDALLNFHLKTFDSLHFYVFHSFEYGLRINDDDNDNKMERISKKHLSLQFNRFNNHNKLNINIIKGTSPITFIDELFQGLVSNNIKETTVTIFSEFIRTEQYETDSIKEVFKDQSLFAHIVANNDKELVRAVRDFIITTALHTPSFNTGFIFYYWPRYQHMAKFDGNTDETNLNDHGGYQIAELFVMQKYAAFKEEMMNYAFLNMEQYEIVMIKVKQYLNTKKVKQGKAQNGGMGRIMLQYGIREGECISSHHLLAVFLYTDFTDLRNDFSSTFRPLNQFESLSDIKARNAKYWFMSRSLREMVELYGDHGDYEGNLKGPFYCGLPEVMPLPEFEVRLCAPTSMSRHIEIAVHFAGEQGMIVELNNNVSYHEYLSGFDCSWLSDFKEEAEVVYMGGHYKIRIESVRILKGGRCQNFKEFCGALSKFGAMFNGGSTECNGREKEIISWLCNWSLGICDLKDEIDEYIVDTFQAFRHNKRHIVFNYTSLSRDDKELRDIIFYEMKSGAQKEEKTNLFRNVLFKLFPNIENMIIYTPNALSFSFLALLHEIEKERVNQITVKEVQSMHMHMGGGNSWIFSLWSSSSEELIQKYREKGYQVYLSITKNQMGDDEHCINIKKI